MEKFKNFLCKLFSDKSENSSGKSKKRIALCLIVCLLGIVILLVKCAWIQLVKGKYYTELAYKQQNSGRTLTPVRGTIYDSNGNVLAMSVQKNKIAVNSRYIKTYTETKELNTEEYRRKIASKLSEILEIDEEEIMTSLRKDSSYVVIKTKVETETGDEISAWVSEENIKGIYVDDMYVRYYPNDSLACHVLGFTGSDDQGLVCGVEVALDDYLSGTPGRILADVDTSGNELPYDQVRRIDAVDGYNAVLTIDSNIQSIVEKYMEEAIAEYGVEEGACCIVMDPDNADVLAMYSYPNFNPNDAYAYPETANLAITREEWEGNSETGVALLSATVWRNKALTDTYEPGSTFKAVVTAMLLEEAIVTSDTQVSDSPLTLAGWTIRCWQDNESKSEEDEDNSHGDETFEEAVKNSCNPVFSKLSLELGLDKFYSYVESFGFYNKTGIMLSGEANSIMHSSPTEIDLAVAAFGQRFQVTPIQLATAYCAIANGGTLYTPRIVKYLTDSEGNVVENFETTAVRQVVSEETCEKTLELLEKVVSEGTGSNAYVAGYRVAGKTGTSETTDTDETGRYVVSFSGIAPSDDPEIVVLVMFDHPTCDSIGGGSVAAPVASKIIDEVLTYMGVEKKYTEEEMTQMTHGYWTPNYIGDTLQTAISRIGTIYTYKIVGPTSLDSVIVDMVPAPNTGLCRGSQIILYTEEVPTEERETTVVPDVTGMTITEAFETLKNANLTMLAEKTGKAYGMSKLPGDVVEIGTRIYVLMSNDETENADNIGVDN